MIVISLVAGSPHFALEAHYLSLPTRGQLRGNTFSFTHFLSREMVPSSVCHYSLWDKPCSVPLYKLPLIEAFFMLPLLLPMLYFMMLLLAAEEPGACFISSSVCVGHLNLNLPVYGSHTAFRSSAPSSLLPVKT